MFGLFSNLVLDAMDSVASGSSSHAQGISLENRDDARVFWSDVCDQIKRHERCTPQMRELIDSVNQENPDFFDEIFQNVLDQKGNRNLDHFGMSFEDWSVVFNELGLSIKKDVEGVNVFARIVCMVVFTALAILLAIVRIVFEKGDKWGRLKTLCGNALKSILNQTVELAEAIVADVFALISIVILGVLKVIGQDHRQFAQGLKWLVKARFDTFGKVVDEMRACTLRFYLWRKSKKLHTLKPSNIVTVMNAMDKFSRQRNNISNQIALAVKKVLADHPKSGGCSKAVRRLIRLVSADISVQKYIPLPSLVKILLVGAQIDDPQVQQDLDRLIRGYVSKSKLIYIYRNSLNRSHAELLGLHPQDNGLENQLGLLRSLLERNSFIKQFKLELGSNASSKIARANGPRLSSKRCNHPPGRLKRHLNPQGG